MPTNDEVFLNPITTEPTNETPTTEQSSSEDDLLKWENEELSNLIGKLNDLVLDTNGDTFIHFAGIRNALIGALCSLDAAKKLLNQSEEKIKELTLSSQDDQSKSLVLVKDSYEKSVKEILEFKTEDLPVWFCGYYINSAEYRIASVLHGLFRGYYKCKCFEDPTKKKYFTFEILKDYVTPDNVYSCPVCCTSPIVAKVNNTTKTILAKLRSDEVYSLSGIYNRFRGVYKADRKLEELDPRKLWKQAAEALGEVIDLLDDCSKANSSPLSIYSLDILVTGDFINDNVLAYDENNEIVYKQQLFGGSISLKEIIAQSLPNKNVACFPSLAVINSFEDLAKEYPERHCFCKGFKNKTQKDDESRYRRIESSFTKLASGVHNWSEISIAEKASPKILVINEEPLGFDGDKKLGFRNSNKCLEQLLEVKDLPWIIWKVSQITSTNGSNFESGLASNLLSSKCAEKLIIVLSISDLRAVGFLIHKNLSWDNTIQDLICVLESEHFSKWFKDCKYIVVTLGLAGVVLRSKKDTAATSDLKCNYTLFIDPSNMEDEWERDFPGSMIYEDLIFVSAITCQVYNCVSNNNFDKEKLEEVLPIGLKQKRAFHKNGFGNTQDLLRGIVPTDLKLDEKEVGHFYKLSLESPPPTDWAVLNQTINSISKLIKTAKIIIKEGIKKAKKAEPFKNVPTLRLGKLVSIDREEIESLRKIKLIIEEYKNQKELNKPLSIAVFGSPGSGKSFAIKELAKSVFSDDVPFLEFNLSQFSDPEQLIGSFHQIRDAALSGQIPIVFWDEFDTSLNDTALGWLRYFLAPMQDGAFQHLQVTHPIGRSVFVFAGGTAKTMKEFENRKNENVLEAKRVKLIDFLSRLSGFVDIFDINIPEWAFPNSCEPIVPDGLYVIRRAVKLRQLLEKHAKHLLVDDKLEMNDGVMNAFLCSSQYKYGTRSMEKIILMSSLSGKKTFEKSCLPSEDQISIHVDDKQFYDLLDKKDGYTIILTFRELKKKGAKGRIVYIEDNSKKQVECSTRSETDTEKIWEYVGYVEDLEKNNQYRFIDWNKDKRREGELQMARLKHEKSGS